MNSYEEAINESEKVLPFTKLFRVILDAKYDKEYLNNFRENQFQHLI